MEKEIILTWLNDSETLVAIREYNGICSVVTVLRNTSFEDDISVYHGHSWEEVFTVWFKDAIESYFRNINEVYEYFDAEQTQYMRDKYNMFI